MTGPAAASPQGRGGQGRGGQGRGGQGSGGQGGGGGGRAPRRVVVDASVALKWQLPDEDFIPHAAALRYDYLVRHEVALVAPSLFLYEITNAIGMAAKRARVSNDVADEALANLVAANVELVPPEPARILRLCRRFPIAAYDAAYVALALQLRAELWTGDRPLYDATRGALASVRWIGDYPLPG